jgi:hypothetical protein
MSAQTAPSFSAVRHDGFGSRRVEQNDRWGPVEVLDVSPCLATGPAEETIRARAARFAGGVVPVLAPVYEISRVGTRLSIVTGVSASVTLADLLGALEAGRVTLSDQAILELARETIRAAAAMHENPGAPAHGALSPAHVLLRRDGGVALSGALFADALQALQRHREPLWRDFSLALPPSASLPRFDVRADVAQLGAVVLAILLRRPLRAEEYPRGVADLVTSAAAALPATAACGSALGMWMQQVLQLHPRAMFATASDAARAYAGAIAGVSGRRAGAQALQEAVRRLCGGPAPQDADAPLAPAPVRAVPTAVAAPGPRRPAFLSTVFPHLRAN